MVILRYLVHLSEVLYTSVLSYSQQNRSHFFTSTSCHLELLNYYEKRLQQTCFRYNDIDPEVQNIGIRTIGQTLYTSVLSYSEQNRSHFFTSTSCHLELLNYYEKRLQQTCLRYNDIEPQVPNIGIRTIGQTLYTSVLSYSEQNWLHLFLETTENIKSVKIG